MTPPLGTKGRAGAALTLSAVAGFVDGAGYLLLLPAYTSAMTGNSASMVRRLALHRGVGTMQYAWPLIGFVLGLIAGAMITESGRRYRLHSRMSLVMAVEILLLLCVQGAPAPGSVAAGWLLLPSAAMGLQTATVTRVGDLRIYTTYVTGSLTKFAEALAGYVFWLIDRVRVRPRAGAILLEAVRNRLFAHAALTGGLWLLFFAGALAGVTAQARWGLEAFWAPIAALAALIALDVARPIAPIGSSELSGFET